MKAIIAYALITLAVCLSEVVSLKTHGESCNIISSGAQVFDNSNYNEACDDSKKLMCTFGKCTCPPTHHWEQNALAGVVKMGGECVAGLSTAGSVKATIPIIIASFFAFLLR